jgi:arabinan endo-1,5-alpha-L-arabinosidase
MSRRFVRILATAAGAAAILAAFIVVEGVGGTPRQASSAGALSGNGASAAADATQPPPTPTPDAPGIVIASSKSFDLPDPYMLAADGEYYMYLSSAFEDPTHSYVPVMSGSPGHWGPVSDALPALPSWALPASAGGDVWDPYVVHIAGKYVMYFAPQVRDSPIKTVEPMHCLGVATSSSPQGPFTPLPGPPIVCQSLLGGDIDAQAFSDPAQPWAPGQSNYLVWKSDDNNISPWDTTTVWIAPLSSDGLTLSGAPVAIFRPEEQWEVPVIEAPQMVRAPNGKIWLFFSAGTGYFNQRYAMSAALCNGPRGGCHDVFKKPLIASNTQGPGPGEETVFQSSDGSTWLLYNPWFAGSSFAPLRPVEAARIGWSSRGPYVADAHALPPIA